LCIDTVDGFCDDDETCKFDEDTSVYGTKTFPLIEGLWGIIDPIYSTHLGGVSYCGSSSNIIYRAIDCLPIARIRVCYDRT